MRLVELSVNQSLMTITRPWKPTRDFPWILGRILPYRAGLWKWGSAMWLFFDQIWGLNPRKSTMLAILCVVD